MYIKVLCLYRCLRRAETVAESALTESLAEVLASLTKEGGVLLAQCCPPEEETSLASLRSLQERSPDSWHVYPPPPHTHTLSAVRDSRP